MRYFEGLFWRIDILFVSLPQNMRRYKWHFVA